MPCKGGYRENIDAGKRQREEDERLRQSEARRIRDTLAKNAHVAHEGADRLDERATQLVVDLAQALASMAQAESPSWKEAYFRFFGEPGQSQVKASCAGDGWVNLVSVMARRDFFTTAHQMSEELLAAVGKDRGVILVCVQSSLNFEVKFEYHDMNRWEFSKMDGGTGIPRGMDE